MSFDTPHIPSRGRSASDGKVIGWFPRVVLMRVPPETAYPQHDTKESCHG